VIDKRIKEASRNLLITEDIVEFSWVKFEDKLLKEVNKMLEPNGVLLNFVSYVPIPEEQTRQAIDVVIAKDLQSAGARRAGKAGSYGPGRCHQNAGNLTRSCNNE